ncbi:MAG: hypothetical protein K8T91_08305 [Planctomycetes bacterium]|nr:hypothetical protein [Planctomycetota bacterium]
MTIEPLPDDEPSLDPAFDPTGPPEPVTSSGWASRVTKGLVAFGAAGTTLFFLLGNAVTPCMGATRSSRLKWEERERQIDAAVDALREPASAPDIETSSTAANSSGVIDGKTDHDRPSE